MAFGAQQAKDEVDALRALDWYLNTTDYSSVKAMQNGETYVFEGGSMILSEIRNTLTEAGLGRFPEEAVPVADRAVPDVHPLGGSCQQLMCFTQRNLSH